MGLEVWVLPVMALLDNALPVDLLQPRRVEGELSDLSIALLGQVKAGYVDRCFAASDFHGRRTRTAHCCVKRLD